MDKVGIYQSICTFYTCTTQGSKQPKEKSIGEIIPLQNYIQVIPNVQSISQAKFNKINI